MSQDIVQEIKSLTDTVNSILASAVEYDPTLGRSYVPARKIDDIKKALVDCLAGAANKNRNDVRQEMTKIKIQEMDPSKNYFMVLPKECDSPTDIEELVKLCDTLNSNHSDSLRGVQVILSRGLEITDDQNKALTDMLVEAVRNEIVKTLANGQAEQQAAIDGAMNGGAKTVHEIEQVVIKHRAAFNKAADHIIAALSLVGHKISEKYYIVDKSVINK